MSDLLLIFDLDGTLVDSEELCQQSYLDLLPELTDSLEDMVERYRGTNIVPIIADLESRLGHKFSDDFIPRYRARLAELIASHLQPMPGANEMLCELPYARCVASNAPQEKIRLELEVAKLAHHFEENLFSAYDVEQWKPKPDLFVHAARNMGFPPERCLVIEDSEVGFQAAQSAGMDLVCFFPNGDPPSNPPGRILTKLTDLPALIRER